jgi:hypothetical protein
MHKSFIRYSARLYRKLLSFRPSERALRRLSQELETKSVSNIDYFDSLKNKYAGQRGFVIGNGPSLKIADLERLQGEVCIASNKIYLAFEKTNWRPSFHTIADPLLWEKVKDSLGEMVPTVLIPHYLSESQTSTGDVKTFRFLGNASDPAAGTDKILFSDDFTIGCFGGYTVTYENLQLAVHLGLNPIYIIGCDHYYEGEKDVVPDQKIAAPSTSNHFVENYRDPGEIVYVAPIERMNRSYAIAHQFATVHGISILNATRGGFLEAFPRVNFDEIVPTAKSL